MLKCLEFKSVGPAEEMAIQFRPRINFLVGDNGLGKTFILDAAWWALTRTWVGEILTPHPPPSKPHIHFKYKAKSTPIKHTSTFNRDTEEWESKIGRPPIPGLVLYAQVNGGFSVWDPARNYWKSTSPDRPSSYKFSPAEIWDGLPLHEPRKICNGLIADWATWQLMNGESFQQLKQVLRALSPSAKEELVIGDLQKISLQDARKHPTLHMPYGRQVPLVHSSAGIRRIVALSYLLVWVWQEHVEACKLRGDDPTEQIIFLIDEVEAHLHPQWQRRIIGALLSVMDILTGSHQVNVQLLLSTHSPLVLASTEPHFKPSEDSIWEFDLIEDKVIVSEFPWARQGDVNSWLTSSAFGLQHARSLEAEQAIAQAMELLRRSNDPTADEVQKVDQALRNTLSDIDRFWTRWSQYRERFKKA